MLAQTLDPACPVPATRFVYAWAPMTLTSPLPKTILRLGWALDQETMTSVIVARTVRL